MAKAQIRVLPSARNTVMVVDDQSTGRAILEQVVRSLDERVRVEGFARPLDAVVWATRHVCDLVLVDYMMPDLDGIALSLKVAKDFPSTKIVMMSGYANQRQRAHNLDFLAHEVISKPFTLEEIIKRVKMALAG